MFNKMSLFYKDVDPPQLHFHLHKRRGNDCDSQIRSKIDYYISEAEIFWEKGEISEFGISITEICRQMENNSNISMLIYNTRLFKYLEESFMYKNSIVLEVVLNIFAFLCYDDQKFTNYVYNSNLFHVLNDILVSEYESQLVFGWKIMCCILEQIPESHNVFLDNNGFEIVVEMFSSSSNPSLEYVLSNIIIIFLSVSFPISLEQRISLLSSIMQMKKAFLLDSFLSCVSIFLLNGIHAIRSFFDYQLDSTVYSVFRIITQNHVDPYSTENNDYVEYLLKKCLNTMKALCDSTTDGYSFDQIPYDCICQLINRGSCEIYEDLFILIDCIIMKGPYMVTQFSNHHIYGDLLGLLDNKVFSFKLYASRFFINTLLVCLPSQRKAFIFMGLLNAVMDFDPNTNCKEKFETLIYHLIHVERECLADYYDKLMEICDSQAFDDNFRRMIDYIVDDSAYCEYLDRIEEY